MTIKLFVIIVTYKGHNWYERCFTSLRNSSYPVQTIVVDNASNDGTVEYIRENFPEIHLIESKENLGFGRANNIGMRYALDNGCDYVFLLNQDAWLIETDMFEKLVSIHQRNLEYGIVGPVQVDAENHKALDGVVQFLINPDNCNKLLFQDLLSNPAQMNEIYSVSEINAAAWLLPRNTLEKIGGFDPLFLHYGEDWNYLSRVLYHGYKVGLTPNVKIVHDSAVRVKSDAKYLINYEKWLLMRVTDLLYPDNIIDDMIRINKKKMLIKGILLRKISFINARKSYLYLKENEKDIIKSRVENKKIGCNWL